MEFVFTTSFDQKAMHALVRGLRKTLRAKRNRRSRILGMLVVILGGVLIWAQGMVDVRSVVTALAMLAIGCTLLWEDQINGAIAKKRGLPGLEEAETVFTDESYHSTTPLGETTFHYSNIRALAETEDYFLLLFGPSHGQVYTKKGMTGGTEQQFREFLEEKTKIKFRYV